MPSTVENLVTAERKKLADLPEQTNKDPAHAALAWFEERNALLDALFYDIAQVSAEEVRALASWRAREGTMLLVPPPGEGAVEVFTEIQDFLDAGGGKARALAVAGVGSSAIGAAAFARNVAEALGGPVAAVVSGYGLSDVATEALGGFAWFGALNSLRHSFEGLDRVAHAMSDHTHSLTSVESDSFLRLSKDTATLIALLEAPAFKVPMLIGHSKGNLVISEALYALRKLDKLAPVVRRTQIVTVSAKVGMPPEFAGRVFDIMGQFDMFGALNSRADIPADYIVPGAWHSTNPEFPMNMGIKVPEVLRTVLPMLGEQKVPRRPAPVSTMLDLPQWMTGMLAGSPWMLARPFTI